MVQGSRRGCRIRPCCSHASKTGSLGVPAFVPGALSTCCFCRALVLWQPGSSAVAFCWSQGVFWERVLVKTIAAGPGLNGRRQEGGVLGGRDNTARPCHIPPRSSLFSPLPSLAPWLLIILTCTHHVSLRISLYCG